MATPVRSQPRKTIYYHCQFIDYGGNPHHLDTIDPVKIGPWLAEMFTLFPYDVSSATQVRIRTGSILIP